MIARTSRLYPSMDLAEADWLASRLLPFSEHQVGSIVPDNFPAYVRVLHPARMNSDSASWAEVALRSGRSMHRLVQFHAIAPLSSAPGDDPIRSIGAPEIGNLPPDLLKVLCEVLGQHTSTEASCSFCLWEGYGWLHNSPPRTNLIFAASGATTTSPLAVPPFLPAAILEAPKLKLPSRSYYLLQGPLGGALDLGWILTAEHFIPQSPNLFWPQDRAWCVASEIDLSCSLVAGSQALIDSLLADPRLEAWQVSAEDSVTWNSDEINT